MKYKPLNQSREFEFSNGMIGRVEDEYITIYENKEKDLILTMDLDEAKQIHEVLGDLLKEVKCEK